MTVVNYASKCSKLPLHNTARVMTNKINQKILVSIPAPVVP